MGIKHMSLLKLKCKRCGHEWVARVEHPKVCANKECKSPYWDKPRKHK